ncbi:MAG: FKBP-type peptidyl-prolyl cis-trans isomerase [Bacteroidia bacterium]|nr:FKBP-type peptidyl-prolyl cis-trans isomerase [Bacteroidia bacterium]
MLKRLFLAAAAALCLFTQTSCSDDDANDPYEQNFKDGIEFLKANMQREGVGVTPSGLQFEILQEGTGASPSKNDIVRCRYKGTLIDGTVFDETKDGKSATFKLSEVIPGWTEGLQLMKEGAKYRLFLPYTLGYGAMNLGVIKPYSTLIFEVELLEVIK